jgi:hypothetical protein
MVRQAGGIVCERLYWEYGAREIYAMSPGLMLERFVFASVCFGLGENECFAGAL